MVKIIGLTGGIASGKSAVTDYLKQKGYHVIDADGVVHDLQKKGGALYQALVQVFGQEIVGTDGQLDRPKLGRLIFLNIEAEAKSAHLQDAIIRQALADRRDRLAETETIFFMDIPLLFEKGYQDWFHEIWLVYTDKKSQLERLMKRNHLSQEEAERRIASQIPLDSKKAMADKIIDNSGQLEQTIETVASLLEQLK